MQAGLSKRAASTVRMAGSSTDVAPVVPGGPGQSAEIVGTRPSLGDGQARLGADEFFVLKKPVGNGVDRSVAADGDDLLGPLPQSLAGALDDILPAEGEDGVERAAAAAEIGFEPLQPTARQTAAGLRIDDEDALHGRDSAKPCGKRPACCRSRSQASIFPRKSACGARRNAPSRRSIRSSICSMYSCSIA